MNFGEIRDLALSMIRDQGGDQASYLELDKLINQGNLDFVDRTDYLHDTALIDLVASQALYTLPERVLRVVRVALGEEVLSPVTYRDLDRRSSTWRTDTGEPCEYLRDLFSHNQIRVYPIPVRGGQSLQAAEFAFNQEAGVLRSLNLSTAAFNQEPGILRAITTAGADDVTGTIRVDFIKYPAELAADTDTPELPRQYHNVLAAYAAGTLLTRNGETDRGATYLAEYEAQLSKAKGEAAATFQKSITRRVHPSYF